MVSILHFHMLFLDGVYGDGARLRCVKAPTSEELTQLTHTIAQRVARCLERQGLLAQESDDGMAATDEDPMDHLRGHSITYRIAVGPQQGRKVFTLQTLPACDADGLTTEVVGNVAGFSLHAGVVVRAHERQKLERLCRYISRPAVSEGRLSLTVNGKVRYELKTPYRDGTTQVIFEPLDFMAKLAALVPTPRVNLTRCHGVFAPNSKHRAWVTPAKRGKGNKAKAPDEGQTPAERHVAMTPDRVRGRLWAQRLH